MSTRPAAAPELDVRALQVRSLRVLVVSQVLGGAGLAAGVTVGGLLAEDLLGSARLAGLPAGMFTLGSAAAALLVGRLSARSGRRPALAAGYAAGALGGAGVVVAAVLGSVSLLLISLFVYGAGTATNLQARYAGADLADPTRRGAAISTVLVGTSLGAVAGPNLVGPTGALAAAVGVPALAGPFLLATAAYALAAVVLTTFLRPDPLLTALALHRFRTPDRTPPAPARTATRGGTRLGAAAMVTTQIVMLAIMTMTPVHMRQHGHGLAATGLVIGVHIGAMYLPSPLTGRLADRYGARPVLVAAALTLAAAGVLAALAPAESIVPTVAALALLGLGWNLGLLGGTTLIATDVPFAERARTQGRVDVLVALAGATGGVFSGVLVAATSYPTLGLLGAGLAVFLLAAAVFVAPAATLATPATT